MPRCPHLVLHCAALLVACSIDPNAATSDAGTSGGTSGGGASSGVSEDTTGDDSSSSTAALDTSTGTATGDDTSGGVEPPAPLQWQADCVANGYDLRRLHPDLECTAIEVPLDWDAPDAETITVGALRIRATTEQRAGTFWRRRC